MKSVVQSLITDNGFFSQATVIACNRAGVQPLLALKRQARHKPVLERFAPDSAQPQTTDAVEQMVQRLGTQAGGALYSLRKQTVAPVEPVFGIIKRVMGWSQMSMRGLTKAQGEWSLVTMAWSIKRMHMLRGA